MATRSIAFPLESMWPTLLKDLGIHTDVVLRRAELRTDLFTRPGASLSAPEFFRLWNAVEAESGDPLFGLTLGQAIGPESFHPAIFAALCSSNLAQALERLSRYKRLVAPVRLDIAEDDASLTAEYEWLDRTVETPASLCATELVFLVHFARVATREHIRPSAVEMGRLPEPASSYTKFFGTQIYCSNRYALTFSSVDAYRPFLTASNFMWRTFEPSLRRRLADLDESTSLVDRVRSVLLEALPGGEATMEDVCRKLALGKRTLQRRLRDEGTSFKAVITATREELARHYLSNTKLSGSEIAYLLGYEDPNSFFRAFHSWTGTTTEQVRLEHGLRT